MVFFEESGIIADSLEEAKEKLKTEKLYWDVDVQFNPFVESIRIMDDEYDELEKLEPNLMEHDYVDIANGCIIFNREEFEKYTLLVSN